MAGPNWMLDTNAPSELVRNPAGNLTQHVAQVGTDGICTSVVVACELRFGARRSGSPTLTAQVEQLLEAMAILPFDAPADERYADIRADLERAGTALNAARPTPPQALCPVPSAAPWPPP